MLGMREPSDGSVQARFLDLVRDVEVAMLTTTAADGVLHSRPMATLNPSRPEELWFFTCADSAKTEHIEREQQVSLTYTNPVRQRYVAVAGDATILRDDAKAHELWTPLAHLWFPGGPTDPALRLVRVRARHIEYWDAEARRMQMLFQAARAALGTPVERPPFQHQGVDL